MKNIILTTAVVLGFASPVLAQSQLESALGVDAGAYSLSQLVELKFAAEGDTGDDRRINFAGASSTASSKGFVGDEASGKAQLAASLGVDASAYTLSQLVEMKFAAEGDTSADRQVFFGAM